MPSAAKAGVSVRPQPPGSATSGEQLSRRTFWLALAGLCALALVLRIAILDEFLRENPLAERPWMDGWVYWQMAERMAAGQWAASTPFLSAPLYPYFLGVIRTLGGDLFAVYVVQLALHLATAVLIGWATRIRFGGVAGLLATVAFLALTEPAIASTRIVANTLQVFLCALLWWRWAVLIERGRRWRDVMGVGALIGLFALAYPSAVLLVPAYALWLWWYGGRGRPALGRALVGPVTALLVISPATLHNLVVHGEFIAISAHGGVTLRHGNGPGARGIITAVPGMTGEREKQHDQARRIFERTHGRRGTWREIDRYFRQEATSYWFQNPGAALMLFARKFYDYFTWQNYDDMTPVVLEREYGVADRAVLAPLPVPWLLGAAFVGMVAVIRRPLRWFPEWALFLLPLIVVLVFFYSPRYRVVGVPVCCALAAFALTRCRSFRCPVVVCVAGMALPPALTFVNAASGIDRPDAIRASFKRSFSRAQVRAGDRRRAANRLDEAEQRYRAALEVYPENGIAHRQLGTLYGQLGQVADGRRELKLALVHMYNADCARKDWASAAGRLQQGLSWVDSPAPFHLALAWLQATCPDARVRNGPVALQHAQAGRRLAADQCDALDVLAAAYAEARRFDDAISSASQALEAARRQADEARAAEIERRLEGYRRGRPCRAAPRLLEASAP